MGVLCVVFESGLEVSSCWVSARICLAIMGVMRRMRPVGHDEVADNNRRKSSTRLGDSASDQQTPTVCLELDNGAEVTLEPGDVVVQNGTRHRWHNRGNTIARGSP